MCVKKGGAMRSRLLVLSTDSVFHDRLVRTFRSAGFVVLEHSPSCVPAGRTPLNADLIVLDIHNDETRGLIRLEALCSTSRAPVLVLRASNNPDGEVSCFNAGASDVAQRMAPPPILVARARALLPLRDGATFKGSVTVGPLRLDRDTRRMTCGTQMIELNRTEFALLDALMSRPQHVIERELLVRAAWEAPCSGRALESSLSRLRAKVRNAGGPPVAVPMRGVGYRLGVD